MNPPTSTPRWSPRGPVDRVSYVVGPGDLSSPPVTRKSRRHCESDKLTSAVGTPSKVYLPLTTIPIPPDEVYLSEKSNFPSCHTSSRLVVSHES